MDDIINIVALADPGHQAWPPSRTVLNPLGRYSSHFSYEKKNSPKHYKVIHFLTLKNAQNVKSETS